MTTAAPFAFPKGFCAPHHLSGLPESTPILVGLSGGADSSVLLFLLAVYAKRHQTPLSVAHINHGIRGEEANRDEEFCRQTAERLGLPFYSLRADIPKEAERSGESIETCARRVRYEFFDRLMEEHRIPLLATAHNADDNLETILFHMARGTGLGGLCGIPAVRPTSNGLVIRPLLQMEKEEILLLCKKNGIAFVTDKTNTDTDYTRNLIRAKLVPVLKEINPATVRNIARMCEGLREDARCLADEAERLLAEHSHGNAIEAAALRDAPPAIGNRALISLFARVSEGYSAEYTHIMALRQLAEEAVPHSSVSLPGRMEGVIEDRCLVLRAQEEKTEISDYELVLCDGSNTISQTNAQIIIGNSQKTINVYKKSIRLYLDSATINGALVARRRRAGDRIRQGGMSKSLKKLLCEKKIPPQLRDRIPVLCDGSGIVAVPWVALRDGAEYRGSNRANALCVEICL